MRKSLLIFTFICSIILLLSCQINNLDIYQGKIVLRDRSIPLKPLSLETCTISFSTQNNNIYLAQALNEAIIDLEKIIPLNFDFISDKTVTPTLMVFDYNTKPGLQKKNSNYEILKNSDTFYEASSYKFKLNVLEERIFIETDIDTEQFSSNALKKMLIQIILESLGFQIRNEDSNSIFSNTLNLTSHITFTESDIEEIRKKYVNGCKRESSTPTFESYVESISGPNGANFVFDFSKLGGNSITNYGVVMNRYTTPNFPNDVVPNTSLSYNPQSNTIENIYTKQSIINSKSPLKSLFIPGIEAGIDYRVRTFASNINGITYNQEFRINIPIIKKTNIGFSSVENPISLSPPYFVNDGVLFGDNYYYLIVNRSQNATCQVLQHNLKSNTNNIILGCPLIFDGYNGFIFSDNENIYVGNYSKDGFIKLSTYNTKLNKWDVISDNFNTIPDFGKFIKTKFIKTKEKILVVGFKLNETLIYQFNYDKRDFALITKIADNNLVNAEVAAIDDNIYLMFGLEYKNNQYFGRHNFIKFDLKSKVLNSLSPIPENYPTNGSELWSLNNKLYLISNSNIPFAYWTNGQGVINNNSNKTSVWEFDPKTNNWQKLNQLFATDLFRYDTFSFLYNNRLYLTYYDQYTYNIRIESFLP